MLARGVGKSRQERFPRSSDRGRGGHIKLLTSVDVYAPPGLQFEGQLISQGAPFDEGELPRPAVAIECAGSERLFPGRRRDAFSCLWVLWRYDFESHKWVEVTRTHNCDSGWSVDFAPIAQRLLHPEPRNAEAEARPVTEQLAASITSELQRVSREVCCHVLAGLYQHLATEIVRRVDALSPRKIGYGKKARYPLIGAHDDGADPSVLRPRRSVA